MRGGVEDFWGFCTLMKDNHGVILYTQIFEMSDEINLFKLILVYEKIEDIIKINIQICMHCMLT